MKRLSNLRHLIWLLVPLFFLWALRDISFSQVGLTLRHLSITQIAFLVGLNLLILFLFSSRWWLISRRQGYRLPYMSLVLYRLAAFGISYYTPGPQFGGEPLQVHLLHKRHALPTSTALAGVTLDKLLELSVNFTVLFAGLALVLLGAPFSGFGFPSLLLFVAFVLILPLIYLTAITLGYQPLTALLGRFNFTAGRQALVSRVYATLLVTEEQVSSLSRGQPYIILASLALSALIWMLAILEYHLTLSFLGASLTLPQSIALLTAARIAFLTPLPGGIGVLEAGQVFAVSALGFDPVLGLSASLLIRGRDLILGALGLCIAFVLTRSRAARTLPAPAGD